MKIKRKIISTAVLAVSAAMLISCSSTDSVKQENTADSVPEVSFVVTDSLQSKCYDGDGNIIEAPAEGEMYYGQDAQITTTLPSYTDNGDGTVTDNNTGLMWQQTPPMDKMTYDDAVEYVDNLELGGYDDWRLPTIQESFTLANLDGKLDPFDIDNAIPYIDTEYFDFFYDQMRPYTGSYWTSSLSCYMEDLGDSENSLMERSYGFNWADGHLKCYADGHSTVDDSVGFSIPAGVRAVRGEEGVIGANEYVSNDDGTVSDEATGLMWSQTDAADGMDWATALKYAEDSELGGYTDWRLPTPKELQTLVEYDKTTIPFIDTDVFTFHIDDCYVWTSTTSGDFPEMADYVTFGHGWGLQKANSFTSESENSSVFDDVHAPGCIRADYKYGEAPEASQKFYEQISGVSYPGAEWTDENSTLAGYGDNNPLTDNDGDGDVDEFDLTNSENAADYICIYNRVMLVRDLD